MDAITLPHEQTVLFEQAIESLRRIYSMDITGLKDALQKALDETKRLTKMMEERAEFHVHEKKSLKEKIMELKKAGNEKLKRMHQEFLRKQQILTLRHEKLHSRYKELVEILLQNNVEVPASHHVCKRSSYMVEPVADSTISKLSSSSLQKRNTVLYIDAHCTGRSESALNCSKDFVSSLNGATKLFDEVEGVKELHVTSSLATDTVAMGKNQGISSASQKERKCEDVLKVCRVRGKRLGPSDNFVQDSPNIPGNFHFKRPCKLIKNESRVGKPDINGLDESGNCICYTPTLKSDRTELRSSGHVDEEFGALEDNKMSEEKLQDLPLTDRSVLSFDNQKLCPGETLNLTSTLNCQTPVLTSTPVPLREEIVLARSQLQSCSELSAPLSPPIISGRSDGNPTDLEEINNKEFMSPIRVADKTSNVQGKFEKPRSKGSLENDSFWDRDLSQRPHEKEDKQEGLSDDDMFGSEVEEKAKLEDAIRKTAPSLLGDDEEIIVLSQDSEDDTFIQNFRRRKKEEPCYKYDEVVRNREERQRLDGYACRQCEEFYKTENFSKDELQKRLKQVCRHRARFSPPPATPPGFWEIDFPSSGTAKQYMLDENDSLPDHAKPKWRKKR